MDLSALRYALYKMFYLLTCYYTWQLQPHWLVYCMLRYARF